MSDDHCNMRQIDARLDEVTEALVELRADVRVIKEAMEKHDLELDGNGGMGLKTRVAVVEGQLAGALDRIKEGRRLVAVALATLLVNLIGGLIVLLLQFCLGS